MVIYTVFILFLSLPGLKGYVRYQEWSPHFDIKNNVQKIPFRLIELMRVIYNGAAQRLVDANGMRFKYEETPEYEIGYIMAEILERYEVMTMQTDILWRNDTHIYNAVDAIEKIMRLYFEVFHLVNMMSEVPAKYKPREREGSDLEEDSADESAENDPVVIENIQQIKQEYAKQEQKKKKILKWKKRQLKEKSQQMMSGIIPPEFDPNHPDYNPNTLGGSKLSDEAYKMIANRSLFDPSMFKKDFDIEAYRQEKKNPYRKWPIDYGWDIPSDWDFKK